MPESPGFEFLLVVPHVRIQNANAISSPLTHGFPAMTAFLGQMWALERKTHAAGLDWQFNAVGVVSHAHDEQVVEPAFPGAVTSFRLTRNPVDKTGSTAAIVEEGRIHLEISLVYAINSESLLKMDKEERQAMADQLEMLISGMRLAGGSVLPRPRTRRHRPFLLDWSNTQEHHLHLRRLRHAVMPGYFLMERDDLLDQRHADLQQQAPEATRLDALLSLSRINWTFQGNESETENAADEKKWAHDRTGLGWIVPIPVGYAALTDTLTAGSVSNARDATTPFRFVESIYSIGEWRGAHRLQHPSQLLWWADTEPKLYRCRHLGNLTSRNF